MYITKLEYWTTCAIMHNESQQINESIFEDAKEADTARLATVLYIGYPSLV